MRKEGAKKGFGPMGAQGRQGAWPTWETGRGQSRRGRFGGGVLTGVRPAGGGGAGHREMGGASGDVGGALGGGVATRPKCGAHRSGRACSRSGSNGWARIASPRVRGAGRGPYLPHPPPSRLRYSPRPPLLLLPPPPPSPPDGAELSMREPEGAWPRAAHMRRRKAGSNRRLN